MSTDKQIYMLEELQSLLEMQLKLARQGNSAGEQIAVSYTHLTLPTTPYV